MRERARKSITHPVCSFNLTVEVSCNITGNAGCKRINNNQCREEGSVIVRVEHSDYSEDKNENRPAMTRNNI